MYRTSISRLNFLYFCTPARDLIVVLLAFPEYFDVFACPLGEESRFLILGCLIVIDYHLHHLFLGAI